MQLVLSRKVLFSQQTSLLLLSNGTSRTTRACSAFLINAFFYAAADSSSSQTVARVPRAVGLVWFSRFVAESKIFSYRAEVCRMQPQLTVAR